MSNICMMTTPEGTLEIGRYKHEYKVRDMSEPLIGRQEFMDFARWLKYHVTEEEFPPDIRPVRTLLNNCRLDRNAPARNLMGLIRSTEDEELYTAVAKHFGKNCVLNKWDRISMFEIPIMYEEDLYNALILTGLDTESARFFAGLAASGAYKNYCKTGRNREVLRSISDDLHDFCTGAGGLPSRSELLRCFPKQYELYKKQKQGVK